jgi:hypothetical protein
VHSVSDVRQADLHTAEPLVPEIAIAKLKKYKSPCSEEIPEKLIQAEAKILL